MKKKAKACPVVINTVAVCDVNINRTTDILCMIESYRKRLEKEVQKKKA